MGSVVDKAKCAKMCENRHVSSKGDRLAWVSRREAVAKRESRTELGKTEIVRESYCFMSCTYKLIP